MTNHSVLGTFTYRRFYFREMFRRNPKSNGPALRPGLLMDPVRVPTPQERCHF